MEHFELVVIGGGQAGASAACEAARLGLRVTLIDENPVSPEWMRLQVPLFYGLRIPESLTAQQVYRWLEQKPLLQEAAALGVDVRTQQVVWGSFPDRLLGLYGEGRSWLAQAARVIFATGTVDVPLPFAGWTLSGVMGAAGAKALLDTYGYVQARRMLILGSGNLALRLALAFKAAGVDVAGIVEVGSAAYGDQSLVREIEQAGVPLLLSHTIKQARGQLEVEEAVLVRVDSKTGAAVPGTERTISADSICIAIGLTPSFELPYLSRCELAYDPLLGGYFPKYDEDMRTSQNGIFVAGGAAGFQDTVAAGEVSRQQGVLAATAAAESLGKLDAAQAASRKAEIRARLRELSVRSSTGEQQTSSGYIDSWLQTALTDLPGDVPICRCEEVALSTVLGGYGYVQINHPDEVKRVTRCGMGYCQGRDCRILLASLLAMKTGKSLAALPIGSFRAPVRPIRLSELATEELTDYDVANTPEPGLWMRGWFRGLS